MTPCFMHNAIIWLYCIPNFRQTETESQMEKQAGGQRSEVQFG